MCGTVTFKPNLVSINPPPGKLVQRFQFLAGFLMIFTCCCFRLWLPGQVSVVQVNGNPFLFLTQILLRFRLPPHRPRAILMWWWSGWNDTSNTIASVADSNGNTYALAAGTLLTPLPAPGTPQDRCFAGNLLRQEH